MPPGEDTRRIGPTKNHSRIEIMASAVRRANMAIKHHEEAIADQVALRTRMLQSLVRAGLTQREISHITGLFQPRICQLLGIQYPVGKHGSQESTQSNL